MLIYARHVVVKNHRHKDVGSFGLDVATNLRKKLRDDCCLVIDLSASKVVRSYYNHISVVQFSKSQNIFHINHKLQLTEA